MEVGGGKRESWQTISRGGAEEKTIFMPVGPNFQGVIEGAVPRIIA